jgi:hypothetical protein
MFMEPTFWNPKYEASWLRLEYFNLDYFVNQINWLESDGNSYFQPFPNLRLAYKVNDNKIS